MNLDQLPALTALTPATLTLCNPDDLMLSRKFGYECEKTMLLQSRTERFKGSLYFCDIYVVTKVTA